MSSSDWLDVIERTSERRRKDREERIQEFNDKFPPQWEISIQQDGTFTHVVGFWKIPEGIVRIVGDYKGEYDPNDQMLIPNNEIEAIKRVSELPVVKEDQNG